MKNNRNAKKLQKRNKHKQHDERTKNESAKTQSQEIMPNETKKHKERVYIAKKQNKQHKDRTTNEKT